MRTGSCGASASALPCSFRLSAAGTVRRARRRRLVITPRRHSPRGSRTDTPLGARFRKGRLWCRPWLRPDTATRCAPRARPQGDRPRPPPRPERHARFVLTVLLSAVLLLTLLLTAFGTWSADPVATKPLADGGRAPGRPAAAPDRRDRRRLHLQLPVAQSAVTAIGYHHAGDGSLTLDPVGRQGNAGLFARLWHRLAGTSETSSSGTSSAATAAPAPRCSTSAPRPAPTSTRRWTAPSSGSRTTCSRTGRTAPDRHPPARRPVGGRLADAPARRSGADGRLERREGALEGRRRSSTSRASSARRSPATRRTRATTSRCRCARRRAARSVRR